MIIKNPNAEPGVCWLIITDGRLGYLEKTLASWDRNLEGEIRHILIMDDSGSKEYADWLDLVTVTFADRIVHHSERIGYTETMRDAWSQIPTDCKYVLQLEDDFTLERPLSLPDWVGILENYPNAVQLTAQRQPWYAIEKEVGGCLNMGGITETVYTGTTGSWPVCEHRNQFTGNPSLYRRWLTTIGWPDGPISEPKVHTKIFAIDPKLHMLFWGKRSDPPLVHHFGVRTQEQKGF